MLTREPIKKPTAMLLWNLRIIMVPPMLRATSMRPLQSDKKPSDLTRDPRTGKDMRNNRMVTPRMEYLRGKVRY